MISISPNVEYSAKVLSLFLGTFFTTRWSIKQKVNIIPFFIAIVLALSLNFFKFV